MNTLADWLMDLLFPPKCMCCGKLTSGREETCCANCLDRLPEYDGALPKVTYFETAVAPFFYEGIIRDSILRMKFHGCAGYTKQFAQWMARWVKDRLKGQYEIVSWVPCSGMRRWSRGYDQAELLAKALARELSVEAVCTLRKTRHNPRQSRIHGVAARRANVLGVYEAWHPERFSGKKILLVDDVLTTGATLSECGKELRMAGSGDLVCAVIAAAKRNDKE